MKNLSLEEISHKKVNVRIVGRYKDRNETIQDFKKLIDRIRKLYKQGELNE